jgi:hypothetical protein
MDFRVSDLSDQCQPWVLPRAWSLGPEENKHSNLLYVRFVKHWVNLSVFEAVTNAGL